MGADGGRPARHFDDRGINGGPRKPGYTPGSVRVTDPHGHRRTFAEYLDRHGPTWGDRLAVACGLSPDRFWTAICCKWFSTEVGGWGLTERGRREAFSPAAGRT